MLPLIQADAAEGTKTVIFVRVVKNVDLSIALRSRLDHCRISQPPDFNNLKFSSSFFQTVQLIVR